MIARLYLMVGEELKDIYSTTKIIFIAIQGCPIPKSFHKIFNTRNKPILRARPAASSGSRWAGMMSEHVNFIRVSRGAHPLGCLPLWGREGVTLVNRKNLRHQIRFYPKQLSEMNSAYLQLPSKGNIRDPHHQKTDKKSKSRRYPVHVQLDPDMVWKSAILPGSVPPGG
jgi:hypothetical protein